MDVALGRFYDAAGGAFYDTAPTAGERVLGALGTRRKPLQDSPTPAGNSLAASLLVRLEALTGREEYGAKAQETLESFAGVVEHFGLYAASYGLALQRMIAEPVQVCVVGEDGLAGDLERAALRGFEVERSVVRLRQDQIARLPPALALTLPLLPEMAGSFAVVCSGNRCTAPVAEVGALMESIGSTA